MDAPGITAYTGTWAALVKVKPTARSYVMAAVYNGDPTIRANKYHGVNFSLHGPAFAIAEVGYQINGLPGDSQLLGNYKLGAWYDDAQFTNFQSSAKTRGSWGFYGLFDQVLVPLGSPGSNRGFGGASARSLWHLIPRSSSCPCSSPRAFRRAECSTPARGMRLASASHPVSSATTCDGPQQKGLLPGPPGGQDYETVIELTYRFDLRNGALFIQPDLQYIIQPGGTSHIENALVLGTQIGINF